MSGRRSAAARGEPRRRRGARRTTVFVVLALAIIGGAAWALLGSSLLVVRHVQVVGNQLVSAAEIRAAARIRPGTPLASLDTGAAARRVDQLRPVLSAQVSRSWPDTVVITVTERRPELAVAAVGGYQLIDGAGVLVRFAATKPVGLPVLLSPPPDLPGNNAVHAAVAVLLRLPRKLRALVVAVSAPTATAVTLRLTGGISVAWGSASQARQKAAAVLVLLRTHARYFDVSDPNTAVARG